MIAETDLKQGANILTEAFSSLIECRKMLEDENKDHAAKTKKINAMIVDCKSIIEVNKSGLDPAKISLAKQVVNVSGSYERAGKDRASVISDAIAWFATGESPSYHQLDTAYFGTKNYASWHGQRSDHEWGGPKHGSIIFKVELRDRAAKITPEQKEACIYYLANIEKIQQAIASVEADNG